MDENLRVALIDWINLHGGAPDPASGVGINFEGNYGDPSLDLCFRTSHQLGSYVEIAKPELLQDLLQFLLLRQVV